MMSYEAITKKRTDKTIDGIFKKLTGITAEKMISELYIWNEDENIQTLIKIYESKLMEAKLNQKKFRTTLHDFYIKTCAYIKDNNIMRTFYEFAYYVYINLLGDSGNNVIYAYYDLLIQQSVYFYPMKNIFGIKSDDTLYIMDEIHPYIDVPLMQGYNDEKSILRELNRYGYAFDSLWKVECTLAWEGVVTNLWFVMTSLIDEYTIDIFSCKPTYHNDKKQMPVIWQTSNFYKKACECRKYMIPTSGIIGIYKNAGEINSILFKEKNTCNGMVLLYKITFDDGSDTSGFYDISSKVFVSLWTITQGGEYMRDAIENFVLENYYFLTCDAQIERKRSLALKVVNDISEGDSYAITQPIVTFFSSSKSAMPLHTTNKWTYEDRNRYIIVPTKIDSYIRKLPLGHKASSNAQEKARELGIILKNDETIVSPFIRNTHRRKD